MHWAIPYLGKPWRLGADGPDAYDCWGLVRAALRQRAGIDLEPIVIPQSDQRGIVAAFLAHPALSAWARVDAPRELDAVLMAQARHPMHVGLWVAGGTDLRVMHAPQCGVVVQDVVSLRTHGFRIVASYRHGALA
jgi:cell wall-associated NlpC family hydrolase